MTAKVKPLLYDSIGNPLTSGLLSDEDIQVLKDTEENRDKQLADSGLAKFKLEVLFSKNFSLNAPNAGMLSFWESGTKLHGGGDTIMHICPGKKLKKSDCEAFIPDTSHGLGFLICPHCHTQWEGEDVFGQLLFKLPLPKWAEVLHRYYLKLGGNVDLVMKYYPGSIREASGKEQINELRGEELGKVRGKRVRKVYPLANIIKDTSAGADLERRILDFLRS